VKRFTTIIGGGLGWALGGPIGAILGAALGTIFSEEISNVKKSSKIFKNPETDFHASLLVLASVVIKADGKIDRRELDFVRIQFVKWFGINKTNNSFNVFKSLIKTEPNLLKICQQIKRNMPLHGRIQIISFLFDLSFADGTISSNENKQIARISSYLGISSQEFHQLESIKTKKSKRPI
jgi:DnaJ like chaperone protein